MTGYPLIHYIRGRKLSKSTYELIKTNMSILDIAQEYGFEYQQSYSRAFKKQFSISPDHFRQVNGAALQLTNKPELSMPIGGGSGVLMTPKFIIKKGFSLIGIRALINHSDNFVNATTTSMGTGFFYGDAARIQNRIHQTVYYGYVQSIPGTREQAWYQPSVEVSGLSVIPEGMTGVALPTRRYAVFSYIGSHSPERITYQTIRDLYHAIHADWLARSGEIKADLFHFERVDVSLCSDSYCKMDIYIPIKWPNDK